MFYATQVHFRGQKHHLHRPHRVLAPGPEPLCGDDPEALGLDIPGLFPQLFDRDSLNIIYDIPAEKLEVSCCLENGRFWRYA